MGLIDRMKDKNKVAQRPTAKSTILGVHGAGGPGASASTQVLVSMNLMLDDRLKGKLENLCMALSWCPFPIPTAYLFPWIHNQVKRSSELKESLAKHVEKMGPSFYGAAYQKTSLKVPEITRAWLMKTTGRSAHAAATLVLEWAHTHWEQIRKQAEPFRPHRLGRTRNKA